MQPQRLARRTVYESEWVNLYLDRVKFPNGQVMENFHLLEFPNAAVAMLAENGEGALILVKVPRYATGRTEWEIPAGRMEAGETEIDTARREILEETGYASHDHELIYTFFPISGIGNKEFHVVRCKTGERVRDFDRDEIVDTHWFSRAEIRKMIKDRLIADGYSLTGLLLWLQD